jgi:hypothetical protein
MHHLKSGPDKHIDIVFEVQCLCQLCLYILFSEKVEIFPMFCETPGDIALLSEERHGLKLF